MGRGISSFTDNTPNRSSCASYPSHFFCLGCSSTSLSHVLVGAASPDLPYDPSLFACLQQRAPQLDITHLSRIIAYARQPSQQRVQELERMNLLLNRLLTATSGLQQGENIPEKQADVTVNSTGAESVKKYLEVVSSAPMDPSSEVHQPIGATTDVPRLFASTKPVPKRALRSQRVLALLESFLDDIVR